MPPQYPQIAIQFELINKLLSKSFNIPTYMKDIDLNAHIKKAIEASKEIMEVNIVKLFSFTLRDNILEWGENFVQDHPNYMFKELEQKFCKFF